MQTRHIYLAVLFLLLAQMSSAAATTAAKTVRTSSKEIENSCRIKAKDIAAETYRGCVSDQKNAQMEQIKREYQIKMQALKAYYDAELKKMSGKAAEAKADAKAIDAAKANEMNVQLKPEVAPAKTAKAEVDESTMDLPEPIPVENDGTGI